MSVIIDHEKHIRDSYNAGSVETYLYVLGMFPNVVARQKFQLVLQEK